MMHTFSRSIRQPRMLLTLAVTTLVLAAGTLALMRAPQNDTSGTSYTAALDRRAQEVQQRDADFVRQRNEQEFLAQYAQLRAQATKYSLSHAPVPISIS